MCAIKKIAAILVLLLWSVLPLAAKEGWTFKSPMPVPLAGSCSVVLDRKIYVIGGQTASGAIVGTVERYDPLSDTWDTEMPPLKRGRMNAAAVLFKGKIFVMGGVDEEGEVTKKVEFFDPTENKWKGSKNLEEERQGLAAVVLNGVMYVLGGSDERDNLLNDVEFFNESDERWERFDQWTLEQPKASFVSVVVNDSAFSVGGFSTFGPLRSVQRFHLAEGAALRMEMRLARGGLTAIATVDTIFAMGGISPSDHVLNSVEYFVPSQNDWQFTEPMNIGRESFVAAVVNHKLYVCGGRDGQNNVLDAVEELDLSLITSVSPTKPLGPKEFALHQNYPNPFNPETRIKFSVASGFERSQVNLKIYNLKGQLIATLLDKPLASGEYEVSWDGTDQFGRPVASGIYLYRLQQGQKTLTKKMTLLR